MPQKTIQMLALTRNQSSSSSIFMFIPSALLKHQVDYEKRLTFESALFFSSCLPHNMYINEYTANSTYFLDQDKAVSSHPISSQALV